MTTKIFKSIFVTAVTVLVAATVLVFTFCYNYYYDRALDELKREAEYVKTGIELEGLDYLRSTDAEGVRLTLISNDGRVIYDSASEDVTEAENHLSREEIKEALRYGEGISSRTSDVTGEPTIYYAIATEGGDILRVSSAHYTVFTMLGAIIGPILVLLVAVLLFAFLAAKRLSKIIVEPINNINLDSPEQAKVYDELKPVIDKLSSQKYRISKQLAELRMREEEFNSITENMGEGMIVINSHTSILSCNNSARAILGIKGELPKSILSIKDTPDFREAISEAFAGRNGYDSIQTEDKHYSIIVTPVMQDGGADGAVIVIIDDTEKEQRERLRREFTSNVSHELKTPLTSISGFAEIIRCGLSSPEDSEHFADNIYKEAQRLITLVGDIIRLTQLDGGEIPYDGECDLHSIAEDVILRLENVAAAKDVSLVLEGGCAKVNGNCLILEEIIYNLCDNGIKYNKNGGSVTVSCEMADGGAVLRVRDTGIGIPADKKERVFERFFRVDKSHSKKIGGTGLGLSIVKHAAAYHNAKITLQSTPDVGTEITIVFPPVDATYTGE